MLEVKDLVKVYKTKGGAEVRALDGVTLSFPEKGMVFLLGRSGSGKSTLLNVCGGLDSPDSGEIIVKGKSSKDFSAGDFDSYRNTYVGFIFQEYNILSEFSVEDNIALALELQGKPKNKEEIARILEQVDLTDFAKRKPNTLSGGQKQRVAIARALVKNPEIIMADEPTGALDSNTGKQVLDTLKKLSEDKLVIVVSHDRDFAEEYGDRIIELMDGKVISDVVKSSITAKTESENVSVLEDDTLLIKSGTKLTDKDIAKINKIISSHSKDILIAMNENDISLYKRNARINDDDTKECFVELTEQPKSDEAQDGGKFIKSKLKFKHAFKIGASGIKTKPFRFMLTLFLSVVSFVIFGLLSCLMYYNKDNTAAQSLVDEHTQYVMLKRKINIDNEEHNPDGKINEYVSFHDTFVGDAAMEKLYEMFGNDILKVTNINSTTIDNLYLENQNLYTDTISGFIEDSDAVEYVQGRAPISVDEIAISDFLYDSILAGDLSNPVDGLPIKVNDYYDITLLLKNTYASQNGKDCLTLKVCGVFKSNDVPDKYKYLNNPNVLNFALASEFKKIRDEGLYSYAVISPEAYDVFADVYSCVYIFPYVEGTHCVGIDMLTKEEKEIGSIYFDNVLNVDYFIGIDGSIISGENIEDNELVLGLKEFAALYEKIYKYISFDEELNEAFYNEPIGYKEYTCSQAVNALVNDVNNAFNIYSSGQTQADWPNLLKHIYEFMQRNCPEWFEDYTTVEIRVGNLLVSSDFKKSIKVVGVMPNVYDASFVFSSNAYKECCDLLVNKIRQGYEAEKTGFDLSEMRSGKYLSVFVPTEENYDNIMNVIKNTDVRYEDDSSYKIVSTLKETIDEYSDTIDKMSGIFIWVGLVLAIFSMLLLFNFISASISAKKKEIGILRAVGARGRDVFKIFFVEAAIVVVVCIVLSIIITGIASAIINNTVSEGVGLKLSVMSFGFGSISTIIAIALLTAFISTFIPVYTYAKRAPVESIRAL